MNILMLTPYLPYPLTSGGQIRTYNLLKQLKGKHKIILFSLIKHPSEKKYIPEVEKLVSEVRVFKRSEKPFNLENILRAGFSSKPFVVIRNRARGLPEAVAERLKQGEIDLIHAETFYMMPNIPETGRVPVILAEQTIEYLGYQSYAKENRLWPLKPFFYWDVHKLKHWERYYWRLSDRLLTMSSEDKRLIEEIEPAVSPVGVVANGVDIDFFDAKPKQVSVRPTVLFVGTFAWLPNIQAVRYLVKKVWPLIRRDLPKAKLLIVGHRPTKEILGYNRIEGVTVAGSVKDIREVYARSHLLLAPVFWGKGTRYKVLEAMATKTPIVATPEAVEGIEGIKAGRHVLLGKDPEALARQTVKLLQDKNWQEEMAETSYSLVKQNYHWPVIAATLDKIYREVGQK